MSLKDKVGKESPWLWRTRLTLGMQVTDLPAPVSTDTFFGQKPWWPSQWTGSGDIKNFEDYVKEVFTLKFDCGVYQYRLIFIPL